ncbi:hypothetical protein NDU88_007250 [Pleurodeles waltl]|uniref:Secreted protein n=1 Tax=Pleurodeles waltl TaxID=8319 RepID=A0AAV7LUW2_PLEWA|nr:hypothetical protein NDU88_007250 [Pleurodeles waltl]
MRHCCWHCVSVSLETRVDAGIAARVGVCVTAAGTASPFPWRCVSMPELLHELASPFPWRRSRQFQARDACASNGLRLRLSKSRKSNKYKKLRRNRTRIFDRQRR